MVDKTLTKSFTKMHKKRLAFNDKINFLDVLLADDRVTKDVDEATLREILDPARYVDSCVQMVDDVIKKWRK